MSQGQARGGQREQIEPLQIEGRHSSGSQGFQGEVYENFVRENLGDPFEEAKTERMSTRIDDGNERPAEEEEDYNDFFSGLQQQIVSESRIDGPPTQDIFDEDDDDFETQLDSTKGLRDMIIARNEEQKVSSLEI